jgi:hypothetical protein
VDSAFAPEAWHDFYVMVGGAAAVLTGLIFVAVSVHVRPVLGDPWHRGRAASSLIALTSVVLIAGAVLTPGQPVAWLGVEVIAVSAVTPIRNLRGIPHLPSSGRTRASLELAAGIVGAGVAILAGISLVAGRGPGLWLLVPSAGLALATSLANAWRLMVDLAADEA